MARKKQDIILENITIEAVAAEGKALARVDGTVLFVQFAVPGDVVDVKVTKKKKNYMEGFILRMVKPSEHRLEPFCKHFGVCWRIAEFFIETAAKLLKKGGLLAFVSKREGKPLELMQKAGFDQLGTFSRRGYTVLLMTRR